MHEGLLPMPPSRTPPRSRDPVIAALLAAIGEHADVTTSTATRGAPSARGDTR